METLQWSPIRIKYKPSIKIKFADALSHLYIRRNISTYIVDLDWPLLTIRNKEEGFPAGTTEATKVIVLKQEEEFVNMFGTLHLKNANNNTAG